MRVAMLIGYDLCSAPWATRPLALARGLAEQGHEVRLLHYPLPTDAPVMHAPAEWGMGPIGLDKRHPWRASAELRKWIDWCDVLHVQKPAAANYALLRLAWYRETPMVYDWDDWEGQGGIADLFYSKKRVVRVGFVERYMARHAARVVYSNDTIARELARFYSRTEGTDRVPCGADTAHFDPARFDDAHRRAMRESLGLGDGPVVVYHGQLDVETEQADLLGVLKRLRETVPVSFLVLGGGSQLARLEARASEMGLAEAVRYAGYVAYRDVPAHLAVADAAVVLLPDALYAHCKSPLKVYEAMAMGLPVVASRVGQVEALLEDGRGVLCAPSNPAQVEDALRDLLTRLGDARKMGSRARAHIEHGHTWADRARRMIDSYKAALAGMAATEETEVHPDGQPTCQA